MRSLKLRVILFILATFFLIAVGVTETSAQTIDFCGTLRGKRTGDVNSSARHPDSIYNGVFCDTPGNYNGNKTCSGGSGQRYIVYWCNPVLECPPGEDCRNLGCESEYPEQSGKAPDFCNRPDQGAATDISKVFGQIQPPQAIQNFGFGAKGISKFLTNLVALIYTLAAIVLIFMILWGAFDWMSSGGDKEKVTAARERITQAFIGIILFAVAFAVIEVIGKFTGFTFFIGQ